MSLRRWRSAVLLTALSLLFYSPHVSEKVDLFGLGLNTSDRHHDSSCVTENQVGFFFPINKYVTFGKCLDTPGAL